MRSIAVFMLVALAACGRSGGGGGLSLDPKPVTPDEFLVQTNLPLDTPEQIAELPMPDPGGPNLAERDSQAELVRALGGRSTALRGVPASDGAFVQATRIGGTTENIRAVVRGEDAALRSSRAGRLKRLTNDGRASDFYANQRLNAAAELARLRAMGVVVPAAPPQ